MCRSVQTARVKESTHGRTHEIRIGIWRRYFGCSDRCLCRIGGPSPRGAQSLILAAKTYALTLDEPSASINAAMVAKVALSALRHRVVLNYRAANEGVRPEALIAEAVERCLKPAVKLG